MLHAVRDWLQVVAKHVGFDDHVSLLLWKPC